MYLKWTNNLDLKVDHLAITKTTNTKLVEIIIIIIVWAEYQKQHLFRLTSVLQATHKTTTDIQRPYVELQIWANFNLQV